MTDRDSLIERFVVMGIDTSKDTFTYENIIEDKLHPSFLEIYPFNVNENSTYLDNFKHWCFPDGMTILSENLTKINGVNSGLNSTKQLQQQPPNLNNNPQQNTINSNIMAFNSLHHFLLTNEATEKKYCSCLLIYEEANVACQQDIYRTNPQNPYASNNNYYNQQNNHQDDQLQGTMRVYVPKVICLVSGQPVLEFQKQFLAFIYKFTITSKLTKQSSRLKVSNHLYERFQNLCEQEKSFAVAEKKWDDTVYTQALSEVRSSPISSDRAKTFKLKEEYLVNFAVSMLFRVHTLDTFNTQPVTSLQQNTQVQLRQTLPTELVFSISDEEVCRLRPTKTENGIEQPRDNFFTLSNFSFRPFCEKISIKSMITLLQAILLEKQILLVSSNPNEIISICEAIFTLIYPLKWVCVYIPLLPATLTDLLAAMMPYVVGISKINFENIARTVDLRDKVVIDLDTDTVTSADMRRIPASLTGFLSSNLKELFKSFFGGPEKTEASKKSAWLDVIFSMKKIFLQFMTALINNFTPFIIYSDSTDKNQLSFNKIFASQEYIEIFDSSDAQFMHEFATNTMMFSRFVEESYKILYVADYCQTKNNNFEEDPEIADPENLTFFLKYLKNTQRTLGKAKREKKIEIAQSENSLFVSPYDIQLQQDLNDAVQRYQNPIAIDLTPHLIKYLKFIDSKPPEPTLSSLAPAGSIKALNLSKIVFSKLSKDWLMPIPKLDSNGTNSSNKSNKKQNNPPTVPSSYLSSSSNGTKVNIESSSNSTHHNNQSNNQNYNATPPIPNQRNGFSSSSVVRSTSASNAPLAPANAQKDNNQQKDQAYIPDQYMEPAITNEPILFFRNIFMEYDESQETKVKQEFEEMQKLQYPLATYKTQLEKLKQKPQTRPFIKDPIRMIFIQEQLQQMLSNISLSTQQHQDSNYTETMPKDQAHISNPKQFEFDSESNTQSYQQSQQYPLHDQPSSYASRQAPLPKRNPAQLNSKENQNFISERANAPISYDSQQQKPPKTQQRKQFNIFGESKVNSNYSTNQQQSNQRDYTRIPSNSDQHQQQQQDTKFSEKQNYYSEQPPAYQSERNFSRNQNKEPSAPSTLPHNQQQYKVPASRANSNPKNNSKTGKHRSIFK